jgi:hypothetical protein
MRTCIVSGYFKIPSKKSHEWYLPHIVRFFRGVTGTVIFFTTPDVIDDIRKYTSVDHVKIVYMKFEECHALSEEWGREFWERQYSRDTERYHSPELGVMWYEKREFVRKAMDVIPDIDVYIWCDAGCVRDDIYEKLFKDFGHRKLININDGHIHLEQLSPITFSKFYVYPNYFLAGGFIAGNKSAWEEYRRLYDETLKKYDKFEISGISDQYITQSCVYTRPDLFVLHPEETYGDPWFKFISLL